MRLADYLLSEKITYRDFAVRVGVNVSQVSRWATGARLPSLRHAAKIADATGGSVGTADFFVDSPASADDGERAA